MGGGLGCQEVVSGRLVLKFVLNGRFNWWEVEVGSGRLPHQTNKIWWDWVFTQCISTFNVTNTYLVSSRNLASVKVNLPIKR